MCRLSQTAGASGKKNFRPTAARKRKGWWWRKKRWRGKQWEAILVVWKFLWLCVQSAFLSANRNISICFASQISQPLAFWPSLYLALIRCEIAAPCSQGQSFFSWSDEMGLPRTRLTLTVAMVVQGENPQNTLFRWRFTSVYVLPCCPIPIKSDFRNENLGMSRTFAKNQTQVPPAQRYIVLSLLDSARRREKQCLYLTVLVIQFVLIK